MAFLCLGLSQPGWAQLPDAKKFFKGLGGAANGNASNSTNGVNVAEWARRSGLTKITPKPYVELPDRDSEKAMAKAIESGVVPSTAVPLGEHRHRVGTPGGLLVERQISPEVCWAACAQMVLRGQGCDISQERMVEVFRGNLGLLTRIEKPTQDFAGLEEICRVLERIGRTDDGKETILASPFEKSLHGAVLDLSEGRHVIAGLGAGDEVGHAYVLTSMTVGFYTIDQAGFAALLRPRRLLEGLVRGPWTYDPSNPSTVSKDQVDLLAFSGIKPDMQRYQNFYHPQGHPFASSFIVLYEVTLADPFPDTPPEITLSAAEFKQRLRFLIRVRHQP